MQIEIYNPCQGQPLPPVEWNYNELKVQLSAALETYKGRVYTDDTIQLAKKDRAALNKLSDAIDGKRKEMKALYLAPYEEFECQAKELVQMVKDCSGDIDVQIKAYDDNRKAEKLELIKESYAAMIGSLLELVPYERIHNPRWLNVSVSLGTVSEEMGKIIDKIEAGLNSIDSIGLEPDMSEQVKRVFLKDYDLAEALREKERIETKRAEMERYRASKENERKVVSASDPDCFKKLRPGDVLSFDGADAEGPQMSGWPSANSPAPHEDAVSKDEMITISFRINVTKTQLKELGDYMRAHGIKPERI